MQPGVIKAFIMMHRHTEARYQFP